MTHALIITNFEKQKQRHNDKRQAFGKVKAIKTN